MSYGKKTGGRQKGALNKNTQERQAAIVAGGITPLEYMLNVIRDEAMDSKRRDSMAQACAPYIHPRLAATEIQGNADKPIAHKLTIEFKRPE